MRAVERRLSFTVLVVLMATAVAALAAPETARETRLGNDVFVGAATVRLTHGVPGDALLAGRNVSVLERVGGDVVAAGASVQIDSGAGGDVYAVGRDVRIAGTVDGSARIAGGHVEIRRNADIADGASLAGGEVQVAGRVGRYAQINGGNVHIDGRIEGDLVVSAGTLNIGPNAVIDGAVTLRGTHPATIAPTAHIGGGVRSAPSESGGEEAFSRLASAGFALAWFAGWLLAGIALIAAAPHGMRIVSETMRRQPWGALVVGVVLLIVIPLVVMLLAVTFIGLPLALLLLLAYLLLLPIGYLAAVIGVAELLLARFRRSQPLTLAARIGTFAVVLLASFLLMIVPILGALIALVLLIGGIGALVLGWWPRRGAVTAA